MNIISTINTTDTAPQFQVTTCIRMVQRTYTNGNGGFKNPSWFINSYDYGNENGNGYGLSRNKYLDKEVGGGWSLKSHSCRMWSKMIKAT